MSVLAISKTENESAPDKTYRNPNTHLGLTRNYSISLHDTSTVGHRGWSWTDVFIKCELAFVLYSAANLVIGKPIRFRSTGDASSSDLPWMPCNHEILFLSRCLLVFRVCLQVVNPSFGLSGCQRSTGKKCRWVECFTAAVLINRNTINREGWVFKNYWSSADYS